MAISTCKSRRIKRTAEEWVDLFLFKAKAATQFGVVHRLLSTMPRYISKEIIIEEARKRGFLVVFSKGRCVVFCHTEKLMIAR